MMKIRMLGRRPIAADGQHTQWWEDGSVHDVSEAFAWPLIRDNWAVNAMAPGPSETKVVEPEEPARKKR